MRPQRQLAIVLAAALLGGIVAGSKAVANRDKVEMSAEDRIFRGFPHVGKVVETGEYDRQDEATAKTYYEGIFLGLTGDEATRLCEVEKPFADFNDRLFRDRLVNEDYAPNSLIEEIEAEEPAAKRHDVVALHCTRRSTSEYLISYRFILTQNTMIVGAVVWDITLGLEDNRVSKVDVRKSLLAI